MNRIQRTAIAAAVVAALAVGLIVGRTSRPQPREEAAATATDAPVRKPLYYRNPMGLADTSPVPKKDAMGMDYIPVFAEDEAQSAPGTVVLPPERVQALGVRTEAVRLRPLQHEVRASGTVAMDEARQYVIAPRFEGWVDRLHANETGMAVRRGQPLLTVYSPQLLAAQEEYRIADAAVRRLTGSDPSTAASMARVRDAARTRLRNWDIDDVQVAHVGHVPAGNLVLTSPANAVVIDKPAVQGARFAAGEAVLRLADLSEVWVVADVPVSQAAGLRLGQAAAFTSPALPGHRFEGRVTFLQPVVNTATRTVGVRIALRNPDGVLRPGLYGDVTLAAASESAVLVVPRSAVIDSGRRQVALVQVAEGRYVPRALVVGRRSGDAVEVLDGLAEGEHVVVAANFLIDAESNLQSALQGMASSTDHGGKAPASDAHADQTAPTTSTSPARGGTGAPVSSSPDPHAGHGAPTSTPTDPHAQHGAKATPASDPHAGHDMTGMER